MTTTIDLQKKKEEGEKRKGERVCGREGSTIDKKRQSVIKGQEFKQGRTACFEQLFIDWGGMNAHHTRERYQEVVLVRSVMMRGGRKG